MLYLKISDMVQDSALLCVVLTTVDKYEGYSEINLRLAGKKSQK
jgi:hypothetical protein